MPFRKNFSLIIQKTFIITYKHLRLNLFHCLKNNAYDNDKACSAKGNVRVKHSLEDKRQDTDYGKSARTDKNNIIQNSG